MSFSSLTNLRFRTKFSIIAALFMIFGLFGAVLISQQQQEVRSRAAGDIVGDYAGDLIGDDFAVAGKVLGNVIGNRNRISAGVQGNIYGSANSVDTNVGGCINGDNNRINGNVGGAVVGANNIVAGTRGTGDCPLPGSNNPTPTIRISTTCTDGIDNNQNELIDAGDPACHTDGNPQNPNSYDSNGSEINTPTQPPVITLAPTLTIAPTPTIAVGEIVFSFNILLHGIGKGGDSANSNGGGNPRPLHPERQIRIEVFNSQNQLVLTKNGTLNFIPASGNFTGSVNMGNSLGSGLYTVKIKAGQFLRGLVPGIQNITAGVINQLPPTTLVNGDINEDNALSALDFNILVGCYSDLLPAVSCTETNKFLADIDDDGAVNQFDYNLFLRELTNVVGE